MAAVLFVVTIPTKAEELRLKGEYIARKLDLYCDPNETRCATLPTLAAAGFSGASAMEQETEGAVTVDMPITPITIYGTFPKRRKLQIEPTSTRSQGECCSVASSSNKDVDEIGSDDQPVSRKSWEGLREILTSAKRKPHKKKDIGIDLDMPCSTCMELVLREILRKYQVTNAVWTRDVAGRIHQVIFTIEFNEVYENILDKFHEWGIGDREGSTVSVMSCIATKTASPQEFEAEDECNRANLNEQKQGAWDRFMNSVRSRLNVGQIVRDVRQDAAITFDFCILLISAAILASFGLVEDSTIFLASSMLISPLMGPIISAIFGTVIKDSSLRSLGMKNEILGILSATCVGFLFGLVMCATDKRYSNGNGLSDEMMSRCELHSLLVGVFTAIPSGAAAAIGILGGNIGSLVGVAISASLLPPAVNTGLVWALACVYKFFEYDDSLYPNIVKTNSYSDNQATELAILGSISMCLTISNVICVYIMGILVLKVKEIAPVTSRGDRQFWKHDIKIARHLNKNGFDTDTAIIDELANLPKEDQKALGIDCNLLRTMQFDESVYQNTWSPVGTRLPLESTHQRPHDNYLTVHHIERLYSTITRPPLQQERRARYGLARCVTGRISDTGATFSKTHADEKLPRCSTMPNKSTILRQTAAFDDADRNSMHKSVASDSPIDFNGERKWPKFIVTPAEVPPCFASGFNETDA